MQTHTHNTRTTQTPHNGDTKHQQNKCTTTHSDNIHTQTQQYRTIQTESHNNDKQHKHKYGHDNSATATIPPHTTAEHRHTTRNIRKGATHTTQRQQTHSHRTHTTITNRDSTTYNKTKPASSIQMHMFTIQHTTTQHVSQFATH